MELRLVPWQDFTEVDNNVTRHVPDELRNSDWNAMVMHYLGLDHIGHKAGPLRYIFAYTLLFNAQLTRAPARTWFRSRLRWTES